MGNEKFEYQSHDIPEDAWGGWQDWVTDEPQLPPEEQEYRRAAMLKSLWKYIAGEPKQDKERKRNTYEFFVGPQEREELYNYCASIAEYLRDEHIPNLVIIDRSSRPLYFGVREFWKTTYPDEPTPNIFFMNPKGFSAVEDLTFTEALQREHKAKTTGDRAESWMNIRTRQAVMDDFREKYSVLLKDKDKPLLVFDSCLHSGKTLLPVVQTLERAGFSDVLVGAVNSHDFGSQVETDFYITDQLPIRGCYPFDQDRMIEKTFSSVASVPAPKDELHMRSVRLRKEIRKIMQEYMAEDAEQAAK